MRKFKAIRQTACVLACIGLAVVSCGPNRVGGKGKRLSQQVLNLLEDSGNPLHSQCVSLFGSASGCSAADGTICTECLIPSKAAKQDTRYSSSGPAWFAEDYCVMYPDGQNQCSKLSLSDGSADPVSPVFTTADSVVLEDAAGAFAPLIVNSCVYQVADKEGENCLKYETYHKFVSIDRRTTPKIGAPVLELSLATVVFGDVKVNNSMEVTLKVRNRGTGALDAQLDLLSEATPAQFRISAQSVSVEPGQDKDIRITFTPTSVGVKTGQLRFSGNFQTRSLSLSGIGVDSAAGTPELVLQNPSTGSEIHFLSFPATSVGLFSRIPVRFRNTGTGTAIVHVSSTSPEVFYSELSQLSVPAGKHVDVGLIFAPKATSTVNGEFYVTSNGGTFKLWASGHGTAGSLPGDPIMQVRDIPVLFGQIPAGQESTSRFRVWNIAGGTLIKKITLTGKDSSKFTLKVPTESGTVLLSSQNPSAIFKVPSASFRDIEVKLDAGSPGDFSAVVEIRSIAGDSNSDEADVQLMAEVVSGPTPSSSPIAKPCTEGQLLYQPANVVEFGSVSIGQSKMLSQAMRLTNQANCEKTITYVIENQTSEGVFAALGSSIKLAPQAVGYIPISYKATKGGEGKGQLKLTLPGGAVVSVALSANSAGGVAPSESVAYSHSLVDFGSTKMGSSSSPTAPFIVMNKLATSQTITFEVSYGDTEFQVAQKKVYSRSFSAGESLEVPLKFIPMAFGDRMGGLTITTQAGFSASIGLKGKGSSN